MSYLKLFLSTQCSSIQLLLDYLAYVSSEGMLLAVNIILGGYTRLEWYISNISGPHW